MEDENFLRVTKLAFGEKQPFPLNHLLPGNQRHSISSKLKQLNIVSGEKVYEMADESYKALSTLLGNKSFFFGDGYKKKINET